VPSTNQLLGQSGNGREEGQTMSEYAVVLGVITVVTVGAFTALGGAVQGLLDSVRGLFS
jgi:Flp pilus assembly pilin Flp